MPTGTADTRISEGSGPDTKHTKCPSPSDLITRNQPQREVNQLKVGPRRHRGAAGGAAGLASFPRALPTLSRSWGAGTVPASEALTPHRTLGTQRVSSLARNDLRPSLPAPPFSHTPSAPAHATQHPNLRSCSLSQLSGLSALLRNASALGPLPRLSRLAAGLGAADTLGCLGGHSR